SARSSIGAVRTGERVGLLRAATRPAAGAGRAGGACPVAACPRGGSLRTVAGRPALRVPAAARAPPLVPRDQPRACDEPGRGVGPRAPRGGGHGRPTALVALRTAWSAGVVRRCDPGEGAGRGHAR